MWVGGWMDVRVGGWVNALAQGFDFALVFCAFFCFYGQRFVAATWTDPSPWSISFEPIRNFTEADFRVFFLLFTATVLSRKPGPSLVPGVKDKEMLPMI